MSSIFKRGRYYYITFYRKLENGKEERPTKSLGLRYKDKAEKAQEKLDDLFENGEINPFAPNFDPQGILNNQIQKTSNKIYTVREAADYFYNLKDHLSNGTVKNSDTQKDSTNPGAYVRAIEHFISLNDIENLSPRQVRLDHFEKVIFKKGIKPATRHFYYRQLRVFWNVLFDREVVKHNYFKTLKKNLPDKKSNTRPKMMSKEELVKLFKTFDDEAKKKSNNPKCSDGHYQYWFKPLIATYFYGGLRRNEAAYNPDIAYSGLKGKNLIYEDGELEMIYLGATKGRRERFIPISREWKEILLSYLDVRGEVGYEQYLFIYISGHRKGWPVTGGRAYRVFKHYLDLADLPGTRTLHGMRHQRVTAWLEDNYNTSEAQFMAGHSSVKVTEKYTHLTGKKLLEKQRRIEKNPD